MTELLGKYEGGQVANPLLTRVFWFWGFLFVDILEWNPELF